MSTPVTLPALGESVTEGTVTRWLKQVGDTVAVDEPLLEVSTDKVDTEIPSPVAGVLLEISAAEDETVEAIEPVDPGWPALGVQWHPELGDHPVLGDGTGPALFGWLVNHAVNPSTRRETAHGNHISPTFHG